MGLLWDLKDKYKTVSIVGMAKNAGKTTALNYLIEEAMDEGLKMGISSTGRDGESTDLVTGTQKPRVFLDEGTLVSVPKNLYNLCDAGLEILKLTDYHTTLGPILLCRVVKSGYVQVAGPVSAWENKKMCRELESFGAELVIIDGAIDRKSIASPEYSDAVILSTGAVLSRSLRKVVEETAHVVGLYGIETLKEERIRQVICDTRNEEQMLIFSKTSSREGRPDFQKIPVKTSFTAGKFLEDAMDETTEYVYLPGALTTNITDAIQPKKFKDCTFILKDPTKIFIDALSWQQLRKKGFRINVLQNIQVAAVTLNPYAPSGYAFEHKEMLDAMKNAIQGIPIVDVRI